MYVHVCWVSLIMIMFINIILFSCLHQLSLNELDQEEAIKLQITLY